MVTWDEAADWYLTMVGDRTVGFNDLASDTALALAGDLHGRDVLDLGCGEGHVARRLAQEGARVTGVDPVERFIVAAQAHEDAQSLGIRYLRAGAESLPPVPDTSMDVVVAVLALHHVDDLAAALGEVRRVLRPGGDLVVVIPHPWSDHPDAGWADDNGEVRRTIGNYLVQGRFVEELPPGVGPSRIRHIGWHHRTVAAWLTLVSRSGFALSEVVEPAGVSAERPDGGGLWRATPRFLAFSARLL